MMNIPIAIFIYKRPDLTKRLWEVIKRIRPTVIYIFADGPRDNAETDLCSQTRLITEEIDWTATVYKHYSPFNLGLSTNILNGLNLVFDEHDFAIVLEDDCIPDASFFMFCQNMKELYQDDERIMQISGTNLLAANTGQYHAPYFFSKFTLPCWGWATWKRAWNKFNPNYTTWQLNDTALNAQISKKYEGVWHQVFNSLLNGNKDSWDVQWMLDVWLNKGYCIVPKYNLINNAGDGDGASYMATQSKFAHRETLALNEWSNKPMPVTLSNYEDDLEDKVVEMLQEFIKHNLTTNSLSLSRQIIKKIAPKVLKSNYNTLDDLKADIFPLAKYTLLPLSFYEAYIRLIQTNQVIKHGAWLQFGSWHGGSTLFMSACMRDINNNAGLFVYDTFGGIPTHVLSEQKDKYFVSYFNITNNIADYKANVEGLLQEHQLLQYTSLVQGDVFDLTEKDIPEQVALACIDVDFYEPTLKALNLAYKRLMKGGVMIIDDYYLEFVCCKEAVDEFFKELLLHNEVTFDRFNEFTLLVTKHK